MATETPTLSREQRQKAIRLRALQRKGNLDKEGQIVLRDLERNGLMPERSILEKLEGQVSGDQGARNLRATGEIVSGAAVDATGAEVLGQAAKRVKLPGVLGLFQKAFQLVARGGGAYAADRYFTQPLIEGKTEEQISTGQSVISGVAEGAVPAVKYGVKAAKAVGQGTEAVGDFFRGMLGKTPPRNPLARESGEFIAETADEIRLGEASKVDVPGLKQTTLDEIGKRNVLSNVASEFRGALLQMIDAVATNSFTGGPLRKAGSEATQDILEASVGKFVDGLKTTLNPQQLAEQVTKAVKGNIEFATELRRMNFKTLDLIGGTVDGFKGVFFNGKHITFQKAVDILDKASPKGRKAVLQALRRAATKLDSEKQLHKLNPMEKSISDKIMATYSDIPSLRNNAGAQVAKIQQSASSLLTTAVAFNKKTAKLINSTSIKEVANSTPETFLREFFQTGKIDTLRAVMNLRDEAGELVLNVNQRNGIRSAFLGTVQGTSQFGGQGLLTRSTIPSRFAKNMRMLDGQALEANIIAMEGLAGPALGKALFPKQGFAGLRKLAKFLQTQQSVSGGAIGAMSIALGTPAAAGVLVATGMQAFGEATITGNQFLDLAGAGTIIIGPRGMANFLANPRTLNALLNGVKKFADNPSGLRTWFESFAAQYAGSVFNGTFVSEQDKQDMVDVGSARIGGAETLF